MIWNTEVRSKAITTVAWDGRQLVSDSMSVGYFVREVQKIFDTGHMVYAVSGDYAKALSAVNRLKINEDVSVEEMDDVSILAVDKKTKECFFYDSHPRPNKVEPPFAMGSGALPAMAIMLHHIDIDDGCLLNMSATEAVDMASRLDPYTGGKLQIETIE